MHIHGTLVALIVFGTILAIGHCYMIGVGRADCTGPSVEIGFMGYAKLNQKGKGIHLRQFARAFIVSDDVKRAVFVSIDAGMMGHSVKREVIIRLRKTYGDTYNFDNVVLSGTHTHGTPGGFLMHLLYDVSVLGFVPQTFAALIDGIYLSITRAHESMEKGRIYIAATEVLEANINRSPTSYLENPAEERAQYEYDVDKTLTQIRFVTDQKELIGAINWFAVHPTSMNNTNHLVSSDNVGYASILLEKELNPDNMPGKGRFVGAFAATNLGDVSPNIRGPKCQKSGNPCDILTSACPKREGECVATGPGQDMFDSTKIIATRIYKGASNLIRENNGREITGSIKFIHQHVDMPEYRTVAYNPLTQRTEEISGCMPAMGYSFAAGTTDGPGAFDFKQGTTVDNPLWNAVRDFIVPPTSEDVACQSPKPILLATGRAEFPYEWQPKIVSTQVLKLGDVLIAAVPGEFTTMAGRRMRNQVRKAALEVSGAEYQVVLAGLSNVYTSYIVTPEEFRAQRYEAASTIYGPQTLTIYIDQYQKLIKSLMIGRSINPGPNPPRMDEKVLSFNTGVVFDAHPVGRDFGTCKAEPHDTYKIGGRVYTSFIAANPRNNLLLEKTFLTIERQGEEGDWTVLLTDASWDTTFRWERISVILGFSEVHITWDIGRDTVPGYYRIRHFGSYKYILGGIFPYEGTSRTFVVNA